MEQYHREKMDAIVKKVVQAFGLPDSKLVLSKDAITKLGDLESRVDAARLASMLFGRKAKIHWSVIGEYFGINITEMRGFDELIKESRKMFHKEHIALLKEFGYIHNDQAKSLLRISAATA